MNTLERCMVVERNGRWENAIAIVKVFRFAAAAGARGLMDGHGVPEPLLYGYYVMCHMGVFFLLITWRTHHSRILLCPVSEPPSPPRSGYRMRRTYPSFLGIVSWDA
jgi:hypothetical protein